MVVVAPRAVLILGLRGFCRRIQKRLYIETTHFVTVLLSRFGNTRRFLR